MKKKYAVTTTPDKKRNAKIREKAHQALTRSSQAGFVTSKKYDIR